MKQLKGLKRDLLRTSNIGREKQQLRKKKQKIPQEINFVFTRKVPLATSNVGSVLITQDVFTRLNLMLNYQVKF